MDATTVGKLLQTKTSSKIWTVGPNALVYEALETMARHDVGALIVLDEGRVVGVFSERDYARKVILKGKSSRVARVKEMMATNVLYATSDMTVDDCMHLMTEKRVRHLPVLDDGNIVGLISIGDVVKETISAQEFTIQQLKKYISGDM